MNKNQYKKQQHEKFCYRNTNTDVASEKDELIAVKKVDNKNGNKKKGQT